MAPALAAKQRLVRREDEGHVDRDTVGGECVRGLEALLAERDLDDDVLVQLGQRAALGDHAVGVFGHNLGRSRAAGQVADPLDDVARITLLLREQRGVRGGAGENAPLGDLLNLCDRSGVDEDPQVVLR